MESKRLDSADLKILTLLVSRSPFKIFQIGEEWCFSRLTFFGSGKSIWFCLICGNRIEGESLTDRGRKHLEESSNLKIFL